MNLIHKKTGKIITGVIRKQYPNRNGYSFGGSVSYIGQCDGKKVEIPSREMRQWAEGYAVGDYWGTNHNDSKAYIIGLRQITKNQVEVTYTYDNGPNHTETVTGRKI